MKKEASERVRPALVLGCYFVELDLLKIFSTGQKKPMDNLGSYFFLLFFSFFFFFLLLFFDLNNLDNHLNFAPWYQL